MDVVCTTHEIKSTSDTFTTDYPRNNNKGLSIEVTAGLAVGGAAVVALIVIVAFVVSTVVFKLPVVITFDPKRGLGTQF